MAAEADLILQRQHAAVIPGAASSRPSPKGRTALTTIDAHGDRQWLRQAYPN
jgi:hypothetical protein